MKSLKIIWLFLLLTLQSIAQTTFSGRITDQTTGMPIPWAHLQVKEMRIGTVSNSEGRFSFSKSSSASSLTLHISCIGYKSKTIMIDESFLDIKILLEQDIKLLDEIVIKPIDVRKLIREAVKKIPLNYPITETQLTGFYRESMRYDSTRYIHISEGILQAHKKSYLNANKDGEIKLLRSRKKEFPDSLHALDKIRFYAGAHSVHTRDFVMNRKEFINEKKIADYDYTINEISHLNGLEVYKISFKPIKSDGLFYGTLYLDVKWFFICLNTSFG